MAIRRLMGDPESSESVPKTPQTSSEGAKWRPKVVQEASKNEVQNEVRKLEVDLGENVALARARARFLKTCCGKEREAHLRSLTF